MFKKKLQQLGDLAKFTLTIAAKQITTWVCLK
jgi:hypothetical protein